MKRQDFERLPDELKEELNKISFIPLDERDAQLKLNGAKTVRNTVVKIMVEEETERRTNLVTSAYDILNKKMKEYSQIKPDVDGEYSTNMVQGPKRYSSKLGQQKLTLFSEMQNLVTALNEALAEKDSDFTKLEKAVK